MKLLIFISILLYGCGEHFDGFDKVYENTMTCTGLTAKQPVVKIVSDWPSDVMNEFDGFYYPTGEIIIKKGRLSNDLLAHEYIHHLMTVNGYSRNGSEQLCHRSIYFKKCAPKTTGFYC